MRVPPALGSETVRRYREELLTAARFLTRLPLGAAEPLEPGALARASWAFPLVGALVGLIAAFAYAIAIGFDLPAPVAALIAVGASILVTGALHEDGLADTADGLGGDDVATRLAIMRDSRIGTYGVLALILGVGLRAAALASIGTGAAVLAALVAAHAAGRGGMAVALYTLPAARSDGLGALAGQPEPATVAAALGLAILLVLLTLGFAPGLVALAPAAIAMTAIGEIGRRRIGGQTGDVLGAIEQGGEAATLIAAAAWAS
jgi:adenosylcobinamide-GDP ribazoletransferase